MQVVHHKAWKQSFSRGSITNNAHLIRRHAPHLQRSINVVIKCMRTWRCTSTHFRGSCWMCFFFSFACSYFTEKEANERAIYLLHIIRRRLVQPTRTEQANERMNKPLTHHKNVFNLQRFNPLNTFNMHLIVLFFVFFFIRWFVLYLYWRFTFVRMLTGRCLRKKVFENVARYGLSEARGRGSKHDSLVGFAFRLLLVLLQKSSILRKEAILSRAYDRWHKKKEKKKKRGSAKRANGCAKTQTCLFIF